MRKVFAIAIIASFLTACNNDSEEKKKDEPDTTTMTTDTAAATSDEEESKEPPKPPKKMERQAVLGYSFFKSMRQHETRKIDALVSIINSSAKVKDTLRQLNDGDVPVRKSNTASYFTENIIVFKYLNVTLIDPDSDFHIAQIHDSDRQEIDNLMGNLWSWAVTPKTTKSQVRLILKVVAEKADGNRQAFSDRSIPIDISLDKSFGRSLVNWAHDNPEKLLVIILIPLIAFFLETDRCVVSQEV